MINIIEGGVTAAKGFMASSISSGVRPDGSPDLCMIASTVPCVSAGAFTSNIVKGAPVLWDMEVMRSGAAAQVVVVNAGIANACTGAEGLAHCEQMAAAVAEKMVISPSSVLFGSTGIIGMPLPIHKILAGINVLPDLLDGSLAAGTEASRSIMTTDTKEKQVAVNFTLSDGTIATLGGCAKGSGMIHPDMCTMLSFLTTDVAISEELLREALLEDVKDTYNMVSVDGDTSTNDTVLLLANGLSGNKEITEHDENFQLFKEVLHEVNLYLAKQVASDGEGASTLFICQVCHAPRKEDARSIARAVVSSMCAKASLSHHDVHWGRILAAMGSSGATFNPEQVDMFVESRAGKIQLVAAGKKADYQIGEAGPILAESEVTVVIDLNNGAAESTAWGCDLTTASVEMSVSYGVYD